MREIPFERKDGYINFKRPDNNKMDSIIDSSEIYRLTTTKGGILIWKQKGNKHWQTKCKI